MITLHNQTRTAEIFPQEHPNGKFWEVRTFPKGTPQNKRIFKTQFHVFTEALDFVEFIAYHEYK